MYEIDLIKYLIAISWITEKSMLILEKSRLLGN